VLQNWPEWYYQRGLSRTAQIRAKQQAQLRLWDEITAFAQDARKRKRKTRAVFPNAGLQAAYRVKLEKLIDAMNKSVLYWLKASFKANEPEVSELLGTDGMVDLTASLSVDTDDEASASAVKPYHPPVSSLAADALPATELRRAVRRLALRWQRAFNRAAPELARWFGTRVHERSMSVLHRILEAGGWTANRQITTPQKDILAAIVHENVGLIRSIPQRYFTQIEGMVMRSVQAGGDLQQLTNDLQREFGVTRRRAKLIARDQNNKATGSLIRARQLELGITKNVWIHSGAGKHPRPTHVANHGKTYDIKEGWWDPAERKFIIPGQLINCRCVGRPVIPGFE
jgi:SPP1 gp7 family putative phage head morphogenesis protein